MEETAMWTGATKDNHNVMVCPALLKYVSKEAESQVMLLKSVRKAREERALAGRDSLPRELAVEWPGSTATGFRASPIAGGLVPEVCAPLRCHG